MSDYRAPLDDMRFVIREIADLPDILALPGWEELDQDTVDAVLEEAGRFGAEVLAPLNAPGDKGCVFENGVVRAPDGFVDAWRQFVDGGWNGLAFSPDAGGQGLPCILSTAVSEIWSGANMAFGAVPDADPGGRRAPGPPRRRASAHRLPAEPRLRRMDRDDAADRAAGGLRPGAGTHPGAAGRRPLAAQRPEIFITFGEHDMAPNIIHLVLARTPDAPEGVKGLSLFLVPKFLPAADGTPGTRNDVRCVSIEHKLGIRGSPTAVLALGDTDGAVGWLVGTENRGLDLDVRP